MQSFTSAFALRLPVGQPTRRITLAANTFAALSMHVRCKLTRQSNRSTLDHMIELSEQQVIDQLAHRLVSVYPAADPTDVARLVNEEYSRLDGRPIRDYIPLFVERNAAAQLSKRAVESQPRP